MSKRSKEDNYIRATKKDVEKALATADWKKIRGMTDRDIAWLIKNDPDQDELDPSRPIEVVLPQTIDVAGIRRRLKLSQAQFACRIGVSTRLVSDWEQGRQKPVAAARALLLILDELGPIALRALARRAA
jgi:putative transcriptional regulator